MFSNTSVDRKMKIVKDNLLRWTCERHASDCPLERHLLRDRALKLAKEYRLTGFKCSDRWLNNFLRKYGFSLDPECSSGPIFDNYQVWIELMRSIITQYRHKDLFHLDELIMYTDISPRTILSYDSTIQRESCEILNRVTVLICCNASSTEKLSLLICGSYLGVITNTDLTYNYSQDASITDELFREWLIKLNDCMSSSNRKILLLLNRNRKNAFRSLELSNIRPIYFPDDFPPLMKPLKRDVFHYIKMIYRRKYAEEIGVTDRSWNVENVVRSLLEAWMEVPRALIIASFQRTGFRIDDCFLEIHCDAWKDLGIGIPFEKFVTFDDNLLNDTSHKHHKSATRNHNYNLRNRRAIRSVDDYLDLTIDSKRNDQTDKSRDQLLINKNLIQSKKITVKANVEWTRQKSLKRSHNDTQLNKDYREEANKSDNDLIVNKQKVLDVTQFSADSDMRETNTEIISHNSSMEGADETETDGNVYSSTKQQCSTAHAERKQSHFNNIEEPGNSFNDDKPNQKNSKLDSNWAKKYETTFVFGPSDIAQSVSTVPDKTKK